MLDLETAKNTLRETGCTCVLVRGSQIITSTQVQPVSRRVFFAVSRSNIRFSPFGSF